MTFFINEPKESIVVLSQEDYCTELFEVLHKHFSTTMPVVSTNIPVDRDLKEYMENPEGILVTTIEEFQGKDYLF